MKQFGSRNAQQCIDFAMNIDAYSQIDFSSINQDALRELLTQDFSHSDFAEEAPDDELYLKRLEPDERL